MREAFRMAVLGIGGTVAAFAVFGGFGGLSKVRTAPSIEPFDALPKASFIAATVDFLQLRRSPVYAAVFGKEESGSAPMLKALGLGPIQDACGFDPLSRVRRLGVTVPEAGDTGDFGVVAKVDVSGRELETCARGLTESRGGHAGTHAVGTFVVLNENAQEAASGSHLGYGGGLLVVGKSPWFEAMLGTADRTQPGLRDAPEHAALRASLTSLEGFTKPALVATAVLPRALRERLKTEMGAEANAYAGANVAMAGVLGVSAVGLALQSGEPGGRVEAHLELVCEGVVESESVENLLRQKRKEWSSHIAVRMLGFGALLDSFELKREGKRLTITVTANADALATSIERVLKLRAPRGAVGNPP